MSALQRVARSLAAPKLARTVALGVLLISVAAAAGPRRDYLKQLDAWTREMIIYQGFSTSLILRATLLEKPYRDAMSAERARLADVSDADQADYLARMAEDHRLYHEVVYSADSAKDNADRFGDSDRGWIVRLIVDGVEAKHVQTHMSRRPSPMQQGLFTHLTIWADLYVSRFERVALDPKEVTLKVGSGFGNGEVSWNLR